MFTGNNKKRYLNNDDQDDEFVHQEKSVGTGNDKFILPHGTVGLPVSIDPYVYANSSLGYYDGTPAPVKELSTVKIYSVMMMKKNLPSSDTSRVFGYSFGFSAHNSDKLKAEEQEKEILKDVRFAGIALHDFYIKPFSTNFTITITPAGLMTIPVENPSSFSIGDSVTPSIIDNNNSGKSGEVGKFTIKPLNSLNKTKAFYNFFGDFLKTGVSPAPSTMSANEKRSKQNLSELIEYVKLWGYLEYTQKRQEINELDEEKQTEATRKLDMEMDMPVKERKLGELFKERGMTIKEPYTTNSFGQTNTRNINDVENTKGLPDKRGYLEGLLFLSINEIRDYYELNAPENIGEVVGWRDHAVDVFFRKK